MKIVVYAIVTPQAKPYWNAPMWKQMHDMLIEKMIRQFYFFEHMAPCANEHCQEEKPHEHYEVSCYTSLDEVPEELRRIMMYRIPIDSPVLEGSTPDRADDHMRRVREHLDADMLAGYSIPRQQTRLSTAPNGS